MSTCNQLDLQTLGSQPVVMPENLPITGEDPPALVVLSKSHRFYTVTSFEFFFLVTLRSYCIDSSNTRGN